MAQSRLVKPDSATWKQENSSRGDSALGQGWNGQNVQPVVPIVPRTVVEKAGRGGLQCIAECVFPVMIEDKTDVVPRYEHHDLAKKAWCVFQRRVSGLPPANAPSDESQPFRMFLCRPHDLSDPATRLANREWVSSRITRVSPFTPRPAVSHRTRSCERSCSASVRR